MDSNNPYTLKQYRTAIRLSWLKLVNRKQLKRYEFNLTAEWHAGGIPLVRVLKAIQAVKDRGASVRSLGVIKPDLARLEREEASTQIGASSIGDADDWRTTWAEDLESLASDTPDPELAVLYRELRDQLPTLTKEEAMRRCMEIGR